MTRGPGVAGVLDGAQIDTGSPSNSSDVEVVMVGHVPDTVGSMVGSGPLLGLPPPELLLDADVPPEDPEAPAAPEEPDEVLPDDPLPVPSPPELPTAPLLDDGLDPELVGPELRPSPDDPVAPESLTPKSPDKLLPGALLPHAVRMQNARLAPVPKSANARRIKGLEAQWHGMTESVIQMQRHLHRCDDRGSNGPSFAS